LPFQFGGDEIEPALQYPSLAGLAQSILFLNQQTAHEAAIGGHEQHQVVAVRCGQISVERQKMLIDFVDGRFEFPCNPLVQYLVGARSNQYLQQRQVGTGIGQPIPDVQQPIADISIAGGTSNLIRMAQRFRQQVSGGIGHEVFFGRKMMLQRTLGNACLIDHAIDGRLCVTALGQAGDRGLTDRRPGALGLLLLLPQRLIHSGKGILLAGQKPYERIVLIGGSG